jgi:hypothetical protein
VGLDLERHPCPWILSWAGHDETDGFGFEFDFAISVQTHSIVILSGSSSSVQLTIGKRSVMVCIGLDVPFVFGYWAFFLQLGPLFPLIGYGGIFLKKQAIRGLSRWGQYSNKQSACRIYPYHKRHQFEKSWSKR